MNKLLKWTLIAVTILLFLFFALDYYVDSLFSLNTGKFYSKQDLINNYKDKQNDINQLKDYYNKIVPADKIVEIEFENDKKIARLAVTNLNSKSLNYSDQYSRDWQLKINSRKVDSILKNLGWTKETLIELKSRLGKANCIAATNGEPAIIGFHRSGMGMYFYDLFSSSIPDSLKSKYNDSCTHIIYNDKVVLEYGGGAIGPQCFSKE